MMLISRLLNLLATLGLAVSGASAAGQVPAKYAPWAALLSAAGVLAAKWAKTPSAAIAAAVPAPKPVPPAP